MLPFTRKMVEDWAGADTFEIGLKLYEEGLVKQVTIDFPMVHGFIDRKPRGIKTKVKMNPGSQPTNRCPCPDSRDRFLFCPHAVALCLEVLKVYSDPSRLEKLEAEKRRAARLEEIDESEYLMRVDEEDPQHIPATLQLELGEQWEDALADNQPVPIQVNLEFGDASLPIGDAPLELPFYFSESQENLLFVLEDICEGPVKSEVEVSAANLGNLLELAGPGTFYEKEGGSPVEVYKEVLDSKLVLDLDRENGELILMVDTPLPIGLVKTFPTYVITKNKSWIYAENQFWPVKNQLPEPLHNIYRKPVYIPRQTVPAFMQQEWPMMQQIMTCESDLYWELFDIIPAKPNFILAIKGSPASLSAILYACYGDKECIAGKPDAELQICEPNPDDLLGYKVRDLDVEKIALDYLSGIAFEGAMGDDLESIVGKREVLNFLASTLPMIRRKGWRVNLAGRVVEYLEDADFVTPVVNVQNKSSAGWFEVGFNFEHGEGESLSANEIQRAIRMGDSYVERNGETILFDRDAILGIQQVFEDCSSGEASAAGQFRMDSIHAAYVNSSLDTLDGVDVEAAPEWLANSRKQNREIEFDPIKLDARMEKILRPYQKEGVQWLNQIYSQRFGGILADDMGLGKTLQTLTWISHSLDISKGDRALIVCPTSLVENWIDECNKFTPHLRAINMTGANRHKRWSEMDDADIIITSYALIRRDLEIFNAQNFVIMVLDEAQHIKNRGTQNAIAVKSISADKKLVLTGTPIENSVMDLWSIMDFVMPRYLGTHEHFKLFYETPISQGGDVGAKAQQKLRRKLHPFLLRRMKTEVAKELPPKIEKIAYCAMTKDQRLVYQELLETSRNKIKDMVQQKGFGSCRMEVFKTLLRLRQASCHIGLLKLPGLESERPSGKLDFFLETLDEAIDGNHRILVFSQFTSMLAILEDELIKRDIKYSYLDGSTKNRQDKVKEFNSDKSIPVFLISLKAGGTGLNLTGADMVLHFDPWWNPAVEDQATDRAYRIGQKKTVYSMKLITKGSVEEKVLKMQQKKKAIINATLDTDEQVMNKMDWEDIQEILNID